MGILLRGLSDRRFQGVSSCSLLLLILLQTISSLYAFSASSSASPLPNNNNNEAEAASTTFRQLKVSFVTGNKMKMNEVQRILAEHGSTKAPEGAPEGESLIDLRIVSVDLPELQEVDTVAIAKHKVVLAAQLANGPCLVEDTSLEFNALGGMPGPYIKWFQDKLQSQGLYNILAAYEDKSATAVCTLAFCPAPHADPVLFTGECHGTIVAPQEGRGFGWDSIFVPHGQPPAQVDSDGSSDSDGESSGNKPFSSMSVMEKSSYSHRGKAVRKWANWLGKNRQALWERQEGKINLPGHKGLDFKVKFPEQ